MKFFRILGRSIRDAFKSVGRNFSLSLASISCIIITLIIVAISIVVGYNVDNFSSELKKDLTIVAFVSNDADEVNIAKLKLDIESISNVESITFRSKTEIKEEMMKEDEAFKNAMSEWDDTENPLQHTYLIKVKDIEKIGETATTIKNLDSIDVVKYGERIIDISLFRENIVNLIVLTIKNIVIKIRAKTAKIDTFCTTLKTVTN